ncbi:Xaa-Pro aminopeptidase [Nematocida sp. LUAm3]|nr:Xaa-Pro aminopeptidase [Nematocida sp. LUAm3]KAI5175137.1 Xaa-Pro aminopeptidase [Nematocida sp. LUAm2]KAI5178191.1 Xaa-Pro aminopeptidase [Nematocida sp. LUAm1]
MGIQELRESMKVRNLDALIVHRRDTHLNEYLHPRYEHIAEITGFTGSNGVLLLFMDAAYLYTDSRYFIQAESQLYDGVELSKMGEDATVMERILSRDKEGKQRVGVILEFITGEEYKKNFGQSEEKIEIVDVEEELLSKIWKNRPDVQEKICKVMGHQVPVKDKIQEIRSIMSLNSEKFKRTNPVDAVVVADMDEVAWVTNLRGVDIPMSRLFYSFLIIRENTVTLYTDALVEKSSIPEVEVKRYKDFYVDIQELKDHVVGISQSTNFLIEEKLAKISKVLPFQEISNMKAVKTKEEIKGFEEANIKDAVSLCRLFGEISKKIQAGTEVGELDASDLLLSIKQEDPDFICPSFDTISAFGSNGAIIHYRAEDNNTKITPDNLYLIDSGSQYTMGTTDITRTVSFGVPSDEQKRHYTALIKGHVLLENQAFPAKVFLGSLAPLVRQSVWKEGVDYGHSTGHGVGFGLNVHESPPHFEAGARTLAQPGMVVTNEPGIYIEGKHGLRHENLMVVENHPTIEKFFLLRNLTPVPLHLALIDTSMLSEEEITYINEISKKIRNLLVPRLSAYPEGLVWLNDNTVELQQKAYCHIVEMNN